MTWPDDGEEAKENEKKKSFENSHFAQTEESARRTRKASFPNSLWAPSRQQIDIYYWNDFCSAKDEQKTDTTMRGGASERERRLFKNAIWAKWCRDRMAIVVYWNFVFFFFVYFRSSSRHITRHLRSDAVRLLRAVWRAIVIIKRERKEEEMKPKVEKTTKRRRSRRRTERKI